MSKVWLLFRLDLKRATRNIISVILLFGVSIIPSFFAWFNVLASWDPFGNVKDLKVAVASADEGFESDLLPIRINVGSLVISNLRANDDLGWVFTTEEQAIDGTKSGEFYAAFVLPPDFSKQMMTFLSPDATPVELAYYSNEKENALTPKITSQAATDVSTKINESFTKTLDQAALTIVSTLANHLETPQTQATLARLGASVSQAGTELRAAADTARMFEALVASGRTLVDTASSLVQSSESAVQGSAGVISEGADAARSLKATLDGAVGSLANAFAASSESYAQLGSRVDELFLSIDAQRQTASAALGTLSGSVSAQIADYEGLRDTLQAQADATTDPVLRDALELVVSSVDSVIARQTSLKDRIDAASGQLAESTADSQRVKDEILTLVDQTHSAIADAQRTYTDNLQPKLEELGATLTAVNDGFARAVADLGGAASALSDAAAESPNSLANLQAALGEIVTSLDATATDFDAFDAAIQKAVDSGDISELTDIIGSNPAVLAGELAAPVELDRIAVFPAQSFGAQMAPFYSTLGLWVGAILLSVLIRSDATPSDLSLDDSVTPAPTATPTQLYLGRFCIFGMFALIQSSLLFLGLIGFVGVRPASPVLLMLAGWVMSLVFTLITYTLALSFSNAGKAISVFLLVIQISGGGGAYPIVVLPQWFQSISQFLPVTHAVNAMRAAIAGSYDGDYWTSIGLLLLFVVPTLLLGLALRLPLVKVTQSMVKALDSTKLFRG